MSAFWLRETIALSPGPLHPRMAPEALGWVPRQSRFPDSQQCLSPLRGGEAPSRARRRRDVQFTPWLTLALLGTRPAGGLTPPRPVGVHALQARCWLSQALHC